MYSGRGIVDSLINKLPFEAHVPGYQYCGPWTKLKRRLARQDPGINPLDAACKQHDIAYSKYKNISDRHKADKILEEAAWNRVKAKDSRFGEKATAWAVTNAMKIKRKMGMGIKKSPSTKTNSKTALRSGVVMKVKKALKRHKSLNQKEGRHLALAAAKVAVKEAGGKNNIRTPRVIPIPKQGGIIPLIPLFAGLSALGSLAGGAAGIAKAVSTSKQAQKKLEESERHNKMMEAIALGSKKGNGLYLKPYRKGLGLYLKHPKN
jgi:hypothetical protein